MNCSGMDMSVTVGTIHIMKSGQGLDMQKPVIYIESIVVNIFPQISYM